MADIYRTIGVVGAGAMGRGIAQVAAAAGARVSLTDVSEVALAKARSTIGDSLRRSADKGRMTSQAAEEALGRITTGTALADHDGAELVIEAAVERIEVKAEIFRELHAAASGALLASNTSSLPIAGIARAAGVRVIGLHFFNPAHVMRLVEVIAAGDDGPRVEATMSAWGKTPVVAPDTPGFIVNRCARPFYGEALAMLEEGTDPAAIDAAMQEAGYRLGPFGLIDLIGADVNLAATETVFEAMDRHPRYHVFGALRRQVATGRLGAKAGAGFVTPGAPAAGPDEGARARIEATLVNEAAWLLEAGGVTEDDIDTAMKLGLNFPRGPFEIARAEGAPAILARLEALEATAPAHLAGRYAPAPALRRMETA